MKYDYFITLKLDRFGNASSITAKEEEDLLETCEYDAVSLFLNSDEDELTISRFSTGEQAVYKSPFEAGQRERADWLRAMCPDHSTCTCLRTLRIFAPGENGGVTLLWPL